MVKYKDTVISKNSETFRLMQSKDKDDQRKLKELHAACDAEFHKKFPKEMWNDLIKKDTDNESS